MGIPLDQLAERIGADLIGDGSVEVSGCAPIITARGDEITFLANTKYARHLQTTRAAAVICRRDTAPPEHLSRLIVDDPYFGFRNAMIELHGFRRHPGPVDGEGSAHSISATIHPEADVHAAAVIHPNVVIERGASVGARSVLYPGVYVGPEATIGVDCVLYPNVVVYDRCVLHDRVTIHGNCVIGNDGFGFATNGGRHNKIPQEGIVVIENDVELGASCAIERAAMGETRIGEGTKFADLISIGHGTTIGRHCLIVSLVGVSGSVELGNYVVIGGQSGVAGHLAVGDGVQVAGRSGVVRDVPPGTKVAGFPAIPILQERRSEVAYRRLDEYQKRTRALEREVAALRARLDS